MQSTRRKLFAVLATTGALLFASGASADTQTAADSAALSLQTPIEQLVDDPGAREVLDRVLPGLVTHRMYETFKSMNLEDLQSMAPNLLTADRLSRVAEGLAELAKQKPAKAN